MTPFLATWVWDALPRYGEKVDVLVLAFLADGIAVIALEGGDMRTVTVGELALTWPGPTIAPDIHRFCAPPLSERIPA